jgi:predicted DNA-binding protein (UPF0251 family)
MPRPFKCRRVFFQPNFKYFKPAGIPLSMLDEVNLTLDEIEAVRLADLEGLYQEDSAEKMGISRQTFGNILDSAHKKIADALINGKAIKIEGGVIEIMERNFICYDCKHEWSVPYGIPRPSECPKCGSVNIHRNEEDRGPKRMRRRCRRGGPPWEG